MTLQEAIKSKKPFRRRGWKDFYISAHNATTGFHLLAVTTAATMHVNATDILADDWEVEEKEVRITKTMFWEAYKAASVDVGIFVGLHETGFIRTLAKKLGLED